jgi:uncharacterized membrane protein (DUF4010 family)
MFEKISELIPPDGLRTLILSCKNKLAGSDGAGMTTEVTGLGTDVLGVLVQQDHLWVGTTLAAASNNVVKGIYALSFADRKTGAMSAAWLGMLAVAGAPCLFWV